jgi:hypothetical protein
MHHNLVNSPPGVSASSCLIPSHLRRNLRVGLRLFVRMAQRKPGGEQQDYNRSL